MLSEEEEQRLEGLLEKIHRSKEMGGYPTMSAYDILWMATRLKDLNGLAEAYHKELLASRND